MVFLQIRVKEWQNIFAWKMKLSAKETIRVYLSVLSVSVFHFASKSVTFQSHFNQEAVV